MIKKFICILLILSGFLAVNFAFARTVVVDGETIEDPGPILDDALFAPDRLEAAKKGIGGELIFGVNASGAGFYDTSEFMNGSVSIAIILPESTGGLDNSTENWTASQEQNVQQEVQNAMNWWDSMAQKANLSFTYHFYSGRTDTRAQTQYEPINRSSYTGTGQALWITEIMGNFGYTSGDYFYRTREFLNDMRQADNTDWAMAVYVANDENSATHTFTDTKFAYAYYGGPFMVMTYNNQNYGINNMDAVAAHETGHIFYALDQYYEAGKDCAVKIGYLNYANQNSLYSASGLPCKSNVESIMRGGITPYAQNAIDKYAKGQIGIIDSNSNNVPDAVDVTPKIIINSSENTASGKEYKGAASVSAKKNKNSYTDTLHNAYGYPENNITTSRVYKVQYRINQETWQNADALDGSFNSLSENFSFVVPSSAGTDPTVELKAFATSGNTKTSLLSGALGKKSIVAGTGFGGSPKVVIFNNKGVVSKTFYAYSKSMYEGVQVAACDIDNNGKDEIITSQAYLWNPEIKVFSNKGKKKYNFRTSAASYGVSIACGDTKGDGKAEIIVGGGYGGEPWIKILNKKGKLIKKFYAFSKSFRGGVNVAAGDVNGDGKEEILAAAGFGGGPQVRVFKSNGKDLGSAFFAYSSSYHGGLTVAAGDTNGDGRAEIFSAPVGVDETKVKGFRYKKSGGKLFLSFSPYSSKYGSPNLALGDVNGNGKDEIVTALPTTRLEVKMFKSNGKKTGKTLYPLGKARLGAYLATGNF